MLNKYFTWNVTPNCLNSNIIKVSKISKIKACFPTEMEFFSFCCYSMPRSICIHYSRKKPHISNVWLTLVLGKNVFIIYYRQYRFDTMNITTSQYLAERIFSHIKQKKTRMQHFNIIFSFFKSDFYWSFSPHISA